MKYEITPKVTHIDGATLANVPFRLSSHHDAKGQVELISLTWLPFGGVGSIHTTFRVKHIGDIYYRLTRGIEIPRNWFSHNES